jgi:hypothetical protein
VEWACAFEPSCISHESFPVTNFELASVARDQRTPKKKGPVALRHRALQAALTCVWSSVTGGAHPRHVCRSRRVAEQIRTLATRNIARACLCRARWACWNSSIAQHPLLYASFSRPAYAGESPELVGIPITDAAFRQRFTVESRSSALAQLPALVLPDVSGRRWLVHVIPVRSCHTRPKHLCRKGFQMLDLNCQLSVVSRLARPTQSTPTAITLNRSRLKTRPACLTPA